MTALAGEREASIGSRRHGSNPGAMSLAGQRVPIRVPRIRSIAGSEIPLRSYEALRGELRSVVTKAFRHRALIQRCQWHKCENVVMYLAKGEQAVWRQVAWEQL